MLYIYYTPVIYYNLKTPLYIYYIFVSPLNKTNRDPSEPQDEENKLLVETDPYHPISMKLIQNTQSSGKYSRVFSLINQRPPRNCKTTLKHD